MDYAYYHYHVVSAYYKNPRKYGEFVAEKRCDCPVSELYAIECKKVVCEYLNQCHKYLAYCAFIFLVLMTLVFCALVAYFGVLLVRSHRGYDSAELWSLITLSFFAILCSFVSIALICFGELDHTALQVLYKCRGCDNEVHITYELMDQFMGCGDTFHDCGRYTRLCKPSEPIPLGKTAYSDIDDEFRAMCQCYMLVFHDSRCWTRKLVGRLR